MLAEETGSMWEVGCPNFNGTPNILTFKRKAQDINIQLHASVWMFSVRSTQAGKADVVFVWLDAQSGNTKRSAILKIHFYQTEEAVELSVKCCAKLTAASRSTWSASLRTAISGSAPAAHPLPPTPQHHARGDAAPRTRLLLFLFSALRSTNVCGSL